MSPSQSEVTKEPGLSLGVSLHRYWRYLLGVALFPSIAIPATEFLHVPFGFLVPLFIAAVVLAAWPHNRLGAPYSFWLVASVLTLPAAYLGFLVFKILLMLIGRPPA
jgi:hypothetical protein